MSILLILATRGRMRFNEIKSELDGITSTTLTSRLKHLEACGIITREVIPDAPVRVEYELTDRAREAIPIIVDLMRWYEKGSDCNQS